MIYYILLIFVFFFSVIELASLSRFNKRLLYFIALIFFVFIGGFRYKVGADWDSYMTIFESIDYRNVFTYRLEPLFVYISYIISSLTANYSLFIFVICFLSILIKFRQFYYYSPYFFASLMVYLSVQFVVYDINGIRQGLALAIVYLSIPYLLQRRIFHFFGVVLIASCFHVSSLIMLPFYFISNRSFSIKFVSIVLIASIGIGLFFQRMIGYFLLAAMSGNSSYVAGKIISYSENNIFGQHITFGFSSLHRLVLFYTFLSFRKNIKMDIAFYTLLSNAYFISLVTYFLLSSIEIIATRGSLFYRSFDIFMVSGFVTIPKSIKGKFFILILIFIYAFWGITTNLIVPNNGLVPYENVIFNWLF